MVQQIGRLVTEAETSQRGYLITSRDDYLVPYARSRDELRRRLATLADDYRARGRQTSLAGLNRLGRADDVVLMAFSEFGRRVAENTSLGTDHGTANHMYIIGKPVKGGHYGAPPSLTDLDEGGNLRFTTDFRRVYATMIEGWLGHADSKTLLGGQFQTFPVFG